MGMEDEDSRLITSEGELRSGWEELQEEPERLGEDEDMEEEEKSSATLWREPERDWGKSGKEEDWNV